VEAWNAAGSQPVARGIDVHRSTAARLE